MNFLRRPPLHHPLASVFEHAVESISTALSPDTTRHYRGTVRKFLSYLAVHHPEIKHLDQLRRDPHILGWMSRLHAQKPPLATGSYINLLVALRAIVNDLAWTNKSTELARLIRRQDIPRAPQKLPRPLSPEQDQLLQQQFLRRNDLGANAFLLIRHTGMRIGECADLSWECLRSTGPNQWAIHVPLGKLKTERMVPVDASVAALVQRLRFFRSLDPMPPEGHLLARPAGRNALIRQLRDYLHQACFELNISTKIVPHQLRHTYATEMLRAGVTFPVLMKLLGHVDPEMTMRYVDIALTDLQREFNQARSNPRYLAPQPTASSPQLRAGLDGVIDSLIAAQHAIEIFRRPIPKSDSRSCLDRLANRLSKILREARNLRTA